MNHSDCDCLAMVLLSHGDDGIVYGTNGFMRFEELIAPLKGSGCKSLVGKPKLFFVQVHKNSLQKQFCMIINACMGTYAHSCVTLSQMCLSSLSLIPAI